MADRALSVVGQLQPTLELLDSDAVRSCSADAADAAWVLIKLGALLIVALW